MQPNIGETYGMQHPINPECLTHATVNHNLLVSPTKHHRLQNASPVEKMLPIYKHYTKSIYNTKMTRYSLMFLQFGTVNKVLIDQEYEPEACYLQHTMSV